MIGSSCSGERVAVACWLVGVVEAGLSHQARRALKVNQRIRVNSS